MRVRCRFLSVFFRLLDNRAHFVFGKLRKTGIGADSENRASRDHLEEIHMVLEEGAGLLARVLSAANDPGLVFGGENDVIGKAGDRAAAAWNGEIAARDRHARTVDEARIEDRKSV